MNQTDDKFNSQTWNGAAFPQGVTVMPQPTRGTSERQGPDPLKGTSALLNAPVPTNGN